MAWFRILGDFFDELRLSEFLLPEDFNDFFYFYLLYAYG
jgi:hypothetical protein